jgi:hypothetical protein
MVVSDPGRAKQALAAVKIRCEEEPALLRSLEDRPGGLASVASRLAAAKINIKCAYATTPAPGGGSGHVVVAVHTDRAEKALGRRSATQAGRGGADDGGASAREHA